MLAKVVHGTIDAHHVDHAARAVRDRLAPGFAEQEGALRGYWMADRFSGQVLIVTLWADGDALDGARRHDGESRARAAEDIGLCVHAVETMAVVGLGDAGDEVEVGPVWRWARATWISGDPEHAAGLAEVHRATLPFQARDAGFKGSFWLADESTRSGVALSFWDGPDALTGSEHTSRSRRRRLQRRFGFTVERLHSYEGIGVAASRQPVRARVAAAPGRRKVVDLGNAARTGLRPATHGPS